MSFFLSPLSTLYKLKWIFHLSLSSLLVSIPFQWFRSSSVVLGTNQVTAIIEDNTCHKYVLSIIFYFLYTKKTSSANLKTSYCKFSCVTHFFFATNQTKQEFFESDFWSCKCVSKATPVIEALWFRFQYPAFTVNASLIFSFQTNLCMVSDVPSKDSRVWRKLESLSSSQSFR